MKSNALADRPLEFDVAAVRRHFPVLARMVRGRPLAYLDNGASAQRPAAVIDAVDDYERRHHANIHRGVHTLSQEATALYEAARDRLTQFINARSRHEVIFVRGTTEAINLVAQSYARPRLVPGDEILITHLETTPTSCRGRWCASRPAQPWWSRPSIRAARCTKTK
jgi:cysteine desulfurase/selenocysteine lyase